MFPRPELNLNSFRFVKTQVEGGVAHPKSTRQASIYHRHVYNGEYATLSCFLNATPTGASCQTPWRFLWLLINVFFQIISHSLQYLFNKALPISFSLGWLCFFQDLVGGAEKWTLAK